MNFPMFYMFSTSVYIAIHHGDGTVSLSHGGSEVGQGNIHRGIKLLEILNILAYFDQISIKVISVTEELRGFTYKS